MFGTKTAGVTQHRAPVFVISIGFVKIQKNGRKCTSKWAPACNTDSDCPDPEERCRDKECRCRPDYRWNEVTLRCENYRCELERCTDLIDKGRVCEWDVQCVCEDGLREDKSNGYKCMDANVWAPDCTNGQVCDDPNEVCVEGKCRCAPNYAWPLKGQACTGAKCWVGNNNCRKDWDENRVCDTGAQQCVCMDGYKEDPTKGRTCQPVESGAIVLSNKLSLVVILFTLLLFK
jgi:hypothetical protein